LDHISPSEGVGRYNVHEKGKHSLLPIALFDRQANDYVARFPAGEINLAVKVAELLNGSEI